MNFLINRFNRPIKDFLSTISILITATALSGFLINITENTSNAITLYFLAVLCVSRITSGYFWGIISSIIGLIGINYYFTYPYFVLDFTEYGYPVTFLGMLIASLITSTSTVKIKKDAEISSLKEKRTEQLYEINKTLLITRGLENIMSITVEYLNKLFTLPVVFYSDLYSDSEKNVEANIPSLSSFKVCYSREEDKDFFSKGEELSSAVNCYNSRQLYINDASPYPVGIYFPVTIQDNILGVIGILQNSKSDSSKATIELTDMILSQVAMALERQRLSDKQREIVVESEKEKMRGNLLRSVSHDLRTPLTGIIGATSALLDNKKYIDRETEKNLLLGIYDDSNWLIRLVENLLSVTRINESATTLAKAPEVVEEIVAESVQRVKKRFPTSPIKVKVPEEFLMVPMDAVLIEQVIINLLENAIKYSGPDASVLLEVYVEGKNAVFNVKDNGKGIPKDILPQLFKSSTIKKGSSSDSSRGLGIGLSICKTIVNVHGGEISAQNNLDGGATFTFTLPLEEE
ncbi:sensor histidine kinase [Alloiococcus sp. CFN-8]|uniref:sensor histidine kinase n=1 Tax=Alloiococcus sp. CFN-8 TaxID=3416081 RepID=UPI003CE9CBE5